MTYKLLNKDWAECTLGELITITSGNAFKKSEYSNKGVRLFQIANVSFNETSWDKIAFLPDSYLTDKKYQHLVLQKGDIVMALNRPMLNRRLKISQLTAIDLPAILYQRVGKFNMIDDLQPKYLLYYLQSPLFIEWLSEKLQGINIPFINQSKLLAYNKFPYTSIRIQKAIVRKIEELFSSLDSGIADLKKAQDQLVIYRQAVLKKAFEGELVVKSKPEKLKNITSKIGSGSTPKGGQANYKVSGIPLVRSLNIHFDYIKYEGLAFIDETQAEKLKNVIIQEGDVLLNITGASIGRVNIAPKKFDNGRVNQHVSIIRPNDNNFITKFLKLYLQSSKIQNWIANINVGATRQGLTKSALENLEIPLPSLKEQHQIVQEIESRLSVCDAVEESILISLEKAKALRQSILKKAFEGKLLSEQEIAACKARKDYEPASLLLERIFKEK